MVFVSDFFINKGRQYLFRRSAVEANEATCMWKPFRYLEGCARVRSLQCPAWETPQPFSGTSLVATVVVICHTSKNCCQPLREATRRQPRPRSSSCATPTLPPAVPLWEEQTSLLVAGITQQGSWLCTWFAKRLQTHLLHLCMHRTKKNIKCGLGWQYSHKHRRHYSYLPL